MELFKVLLIILNKSIIDVKLLLYLIQLRLIYIKRRRILWKFVV